MSNQNVGGIAWTVDADTSPAIKSTAEFNSQVDKVERTLQGLDTQVSKTAKEVNKATSGMKANFGQAGIQVQQFVGQIQGGQSAMLALSQQAADIGIVLGAPMVGVVVALAASFAGMLLPSLFDSADAIEELEKATENLQAAFTLSAEGVEQYSKKMEGLKQISEGLFDISMRNLLAEQQRALIMAAEGADKYVDSYRGLNYQQDLFGQKSEEAFRSFVELSEATRRFKADPTIESLQILESAMDRASKAGMTNTKAGTDLLNVLVDLAVKFRTGEKRVEKLTGSLEKGTTALDFAGKSAANYESILQRLEIRGETLRSSQLKLEKQLTLAQAAEDGVSASMRDSIAAAYDKLIANEQLAESERERAKAAREAEKEEREQDKRRRESAKRVKQIKGAVDFAKGITERGDTRSPELIALEKEQEELDALRHKGLISEQLYQNALTQIRRDGEEARTMITAAALGSFSQSFDSLAQVFKDAQGEQSTAFRAMFALSKGFAVAQAGLNLSKAISDALAWGGLSLPEKFASVAAISAAGAGFISSIASATYSGREHGGTVMAGTPYEVGEKNKPELLMIPGNNGKVFSNAEMRSFMNGGSGGGSAPIVNIHNYSGSPVETRTSGGLTEQQVIDIIIGQTSNGNTRAMRNITRLTSATNNAAANRR